MSWKNLFTGRDNRTIDIGRVLWFECVQAFLAVTVYLIYRGHDLDLIEWGGAVAALLASGGAAIGLKSNAEPHPGDWNGNGVPDRDEFGPRRNKRNGGNGGKRDDDDARGIEVDDPDQN